MFAPQYVDAIDKAVAAGRTIAEIDESIIVTAADCDEDQQAALWLYAWSSYPNADQREYVGTLLALSGD